MRRLPVCHPRQSAAGALPASRSPGSCPARSSNILSGIGFTQARRPTRTPRTLARSRRQAGCMARTEKRRRTARLPEQISVAVAAAEDKKANGLVVLDLRKAAGFTDYFVICSGQNARQVRAIADAVIETLATHGAKPAHVERYDRPEWVLLDYFDFIVHIFAPQTRMFYGLERLCGTAERIEVPAASQ